MHVGIEAGKDTARRVFIVDALGSLTIPSSLPTSRRCSKSRVENPELRESEASAMQSQHGGASILYRAHPAGAQSSSTHFRDRAEQCQYTDLFSEQICTPIL